MSIKCLGLGGKHYEKWRKCWLQAFSPFPTTFSKCLPITFIKKLGLFGKGLKQFCDRKLEERSREDKEQSYIFTSLEKKNICVEFCLGSSPV